MTMYKEIAKKIRQYETIVIFRHNRPDMDALGSQWGLKHLIEQNYKNKKVYVVGDSSKFDFLGKMNVISDEIIQNSLAIILDVAVAALISDQRYILAKERMVIDHHQNECNLKNTSVYVDTNAAATCEMITQFAIENHLKITPESATALYSGIVTDSGRFLYHVQPKLFQISAILMQSGANAKWIYNKLYQETVEEKKMRAYFTTKFEINDAGVAYLMNDESVFDLFPVDVATISRGMVNCMANTKGVDIWANFTYDKESKKVLGEFRSKEIEIVEIAKKYGGGGHALACGATLENFEVAKQVIADFSNLLKGKK